MNIFRIAFFTLLVQTAASPQTRPQPAATASVEGTVVKLGTNEPISGADVELTRVEGTSAAPLADGAAAVLARALIGAGNNAATVPKEIVPEVIYKKTGDAGKFKFDNLKEGKYRLVAVRIGGAYQPAEYGQRDPRGRGLNFPVAAGQVVTGAKLEMAATGAITGRVTDADGQPIGHMSVMALAPLVQNGRRYLTIVEVGITDDHGEYRLFWLSPGRYYVAVKFEDLQRRSVSPVAQPPGRSATGERAGAPVVTRRRLPTGELVEETTAVVYYGDVLDPDQARPIEIPPGTTFSAANIFLGAGKMRARHIRGTVADSTGLPGSGAEVTAIPRQWSPNVLVLKGTADANGAFDLSGAVPGSYALFVTASTKGSGEAAALFASVGIDATVVAALARQTGLSVSVVSNLLGLSSVKELGYVPVDLANADVDNIKVVTTAGIRLSGHTTIEGRPLNDSDLAKIRIGLTRDPDIILMPDAMIPLPSLPPLPTTPGAVAPPPRPGNGQVLENGSFNILATLGDFQVAVASIPPDSYVKSIRMGNLDVMGGGLQVRGALDNPLDIVIGTDGGEITGIVTNDKGETMPNVIVALVPESALVRRRVDLYKSATTDFAGKFRLQTIPPGTYKLFSWEYVDPDVWQDAQFLQTYETSGKSITIREGSSQETQLKLIPVRR